MEVRHLVGVVFNFKEKKVNTAIIIMIVTIVVAILIRIFGNALSAAKANLTDISSG